jgi:hypothetical protein
MRIVFAALAATFFLQSAHAEKWIHLTTTDDGTAMYVDRDSIRSIDGRAVAHFFDRYDKPNSLDQESQSLFIAFDCKARKSAVLYLSGFTDREGKKAYNYHDKTIRGLPDKDVIRALQAKDRTGGFRPDSSPFVDLICDYVAESGGASAAPVLAPKRTTDWQKMWTAMNGSKVEAEVYVDLNSIRTVYGRAVVHVRQIFERPREATSSENLTVAAQSQLWAFDCAQKTGTILYSTDYNDRAATYEVTYQNRSVDSLSDADIEEAIRTPDVYGPSDVTGGMNLEYMKFACGRAVKN